MISFGSYILIALSVIMLTITAALALSNGSAKQMDKKRNPPFKKKRRSKNERR